MEYIIIASLLIIIVVLALFLYRNNSNNAIQTELQKEYISNISNELVSIIDSKIQKGFIDSLNSLHEKDNKILDKKLEKSDKSIASANQYLNNLLDLKTNNIEKTVMSLKDDFQNKISDSLSKLYEIDEKILDSKLTKSERLLKETNAKIDSLLEKKTKIIQDSIINLNKVISETYGKTENIEAKRITDQNNIVQIIEKTSAKCEELSNSANRLSDILSNNQSRGQWGERMAEDILNMIGFKEGIQYKKQEKQNNNSRPDFSFFLPNDKLINMDVKFPFQNYERYLSAKNIEDKKRFKKLFLTDFISRVNSLKNNKYTNENKAIDLTIMFIPNEQVFNFLQINSLDVIEQCMKEKITIASPTTLYIILSIIRQSIENFNINNNAEEMFKLISDFEGEWEKINKSSINLEKKLEAVASEVHTLLSTRNRKLEIVMEKIRKFKRNKLISMKKDSETNLLEV